MRACVSAADCRLGLGLGQWVAASWPGFIGQWQANQRKVLRPAPQPAWPLMEGRFSASWTSFQPCGALGIAFHLMHTHKHIFVHKYILNSCQTLASHACPVTWLTHIGNQEPKSKLENEFRMRAACHICANQNIMTAFSFINWTSRLPLLPPPASRSSTRQARHLPPLKTN